MDFFFELPRGCRGANIEVGGRGGTYALSYTKQSWALQLFIPSTVLPIFISVHSETRLDHTWPFKSETTTLSTERWGFSRLSLSLVPLGERGGSPKLSSTWGLNFLVRTRLGKPSEGTPSQPPFLFFLLATAADRPSNGPAMADG